MPAPTHGAMPTPLSLAVDRPSASQGIIADPLPVRLGRMANIHLPNARRGEGAETPIGSVLRAEPAGHKRPLEHKLHRSGRIARKLYCRTHVSVGVSEV